MRLKKAEEFPTCEDCEAELLDCLCTLWRGKCPVCGVVQISQAKKPTRCINRRTVAGKTTRCGKKLIGVFCIWPRA
jgi:hypothetical protein